MTLQAFQRASYSVVQSLGETVIVTTPGEPPFITKGIVHSAEDYEQDPITGEVEDIRRSTNLSVARADADRVERGALLQFRDKAYRAGPRTDDGEGLVRFRLEDWGDA